jgi:hypothetical protein
MQHIKTDNTVAAVTGIVPTIQPKMILIQITQQLKATPSIPKLEPRTVTSKL